MKAHVIIKCVDESSRPFTTAKDGMWGPLPTGDLFLHWAKIHSLYCLANSFFFHDKSISSPGEKVSGILPLPPNLPTFYKFLTEKNFVQWFLILWWFCKLLTKSLWRIFTFVLILKQHDNCVISNSDSWWCCFIVVEIFNCSMNECFFINGKGNGHSIWACYVDYSIHKIKVNPLKVIVTDAQTNFVQDLYHQLCSRVIMKQFSQSYMKRIVFLSIIYNIMDNLKYSVTFTLDVNRFGSMRKQNFEEPLPWLKMTCGVGLIANITVFCRIVCSFETEFELATLVTFFTTIVGFRGFQYCKALPGKQTVVLFWEVNWSHTLNGFLNMKNIKMLPYKVPKYQKNAFLGHFQLFHGYDLLAYSH